MYVIIMPSKKIGDFNNLTENDWGLDVIANIVKVNDVIEDVSCASCGQNALYRDLEIEDDTGSCNLRIKIGKNISNEYIKSLDGKKRIKLIGVGWLGVQRRLSTIVNKKFPDQSSKVLVDDEIERELARDRL